MFVKRQRVSFGSTGGTGRSRRAELDSGAGLWSRDVLVTPPTARSDGHNLNIWNKQQKLFRGCWRGRHPILGGSHDLRLRALCCRVLVAGSSYYKHYNAEHQEEIIALVIIWRSCASRSNTLSKNTSEFYSFFFVVFPVQQHFYSKTFRFSFSARKL